MTCCLGRFNGNLRLFVSIVPLYEHRRQGIPELIRSRLIELEVVQGSVSSWTKAFND
jgi:hypothetical protein